MTTPSVSVRLAGSPLGAIVLFGLSAAVIAGWYQGYVRAWVALVAAVMVFKTFGAIGQVRRYKQWRAKWDGMGRQNEAQSPRSKDHPWRRLFFIILAIGVTFGLPLGLGEKPVPGPHPWLLLAWLIAAFYLIVTAIRSWGKKRAARFKAADAAPAIVEWLVPRAAGGPTRAEATRMLPEHCISMLQQGEVQSSR
jgi:hypothetical protein